MNPLADRIRPQTLDEVVGQQHLIGEGRLLRNIIENNNVPNMIFYGPSGIGKTTVANIIANKTGKRIYRLNATTASVADIKQIVDTLDTLLAVNGVLLEFMENGKITLIASTTENPYFYVYNAVLSRSVVFEFKPLEDKDIEKAVERGVEILANEDYKNFKLQVDKDAIEHFAAAAGGDVRKALNSLEASVLATIPDEEEKIHITLDTAEQATQKKAMRYDRDGDSHYDILSAFQKSMRGSDPDAAVYYLARLLSAGDMQSACRRLMVTACEDVGLAYPNAVSVVKSCIDAALMLGMPEARIPLAEAVIFVATAPKSNSAINAIDAAMADIEAFDTGDIPDDLKDAHYGGAKKLGRGTGYKYPHMYPGHYVEQQYLPDKIKDKKYYEFGDNKTEQAALLYSNKIRGKL